MFPRIALRGIVMIGVFAIAGSALARDRVHEYFNETALRVKAADGAEQKREILTENLDAMTKALDMVQRAPLTSDRDIAELDRIKATLQERSDELAGADGFDRVSDGELDAFSTFIVQDMEQADQKITISVVTLLLIIIIVILVA